VPLARLNSCKVNSNVAVYSAAHLLFLFVCFVTGTWWTWRTWWIVKHVKNTHRDNERFLFYTVFIRDSENAVLW